MASICWHWYHLGSLLEIQIQRPYPRPTKSETLGSECNSGRYNKSYEWFWGIQKFENHWSYPIISFYNNKTETVTTQLFNSVLSLGFHTAKDFKYYLYSADFQIGISRPLSKTHIQLLTWHLHLSVTGTSNLQVQTPYLLQGYTSQQMCVLLPSCSN